MSVVFTEFHHDSNLGFCIFWGTDMTISERLAAKARQELEIIEPLSANDRKDWKRYREEVSIHQDSVCSFVDILAEIRDRKLYREEYGTFDAYVDAELGQSRRHIDRLIHHNEVKTILGPRGPKITEMESRQLSSVPPAKIPGVIKKADAKAKKEGRKRTAADVKAVAAKVKPKAKKPPKVKPQLTKEEQIKAECKKARSYAEYLQRSIDDLNHIKRSAVHPELIKLCGQILKGLEKW